MNIEITSFNSYRKNTLQGFVAVRLTETGLEIGGIAVHEKDGKRSMVTASGQTLQKAGRENRMDISDQLP